MRKFLFTKTGIQGSENLHAISYKTPRRSYQDKRINDCIMDELFPTGGLLQSYYKIQVPAQASYQCIQLQVCRTVTRLQSDETVPLPAMLRRSERYASSQYRSGHVE